MRVLFFVLAMVFSVSAFAQDADGDGIVTETCVCTPIDNCPGVYNPDQGDCDSDGVGDLCDVTSGCIDTDIPADTEDTDTSVDTEGEPVETDPYIIANCIQPSEDIYSTLTLDVIANINDILNDGQDQNGKMFMAVGDSISSTGGLGAYFLGNCGYPVGQVEVAKGWVGIRDLRCFPELSNSVDYFSSNSINPYTRKSLAAASGQTALWSITGSPSPIEKEIAETNPQYALIMFGANDVYGINGLTQEYRIDLIVDNVMAVADYCIERGVIPIVFASSPRVNYLFEMELLSQKLRDAAEAESLPFVDFHMASLPLPNYGLGADNIHPKYWSYNRMCVFTETALDYGCNMHNLVALKALDNIFEVISY